MTPPNGPAQVDPTVLPVGPAVPGRVPHPGAQPRWRRLVPTARGVRATVAGWRSATFARSWADRGLLLALTVVVVFAAVLAVAIPRLLVRTFDDGVRAAVRDAGPAADLVLGVPLEAVPAADLGAQAAQVVRPQEIRELAAQARGNLPPGIAAFAGGSSVSVASGTLVTSRLRSPGEEWATPKDGLNVTLGAVLAPENGAGPGETGAPAVRYVSGEAPEVAKEPTDAGTVPIAVSQEAAQRAGLEVGTRLRVETQAQHALQLKVTGVYEPVDPDDPAWDLLPGAVRPDVLVGVASTYVNIAGLIAESGVTTAELALAPERLTMSSRQAIDPAGLDSTTARTLAASVEELAEQPAQLLTDQEGMTLTSGLPGVVRTHLASASATRAQLSLVLVGVVGAAAVIMVLGTHLLIARRRSGLALEHARGASLSSVAFRLLLESALLTALACGVGAVAAVLLVPDAPASWLPLALLVSVSLAAAPLIGAWTARKAWARRRTPANRRARGRLAAGVRARRLVVELVVVALALGAVVAVRNRGLLTAPDAGIDLLLAAAPLLIALVATIVVLHLYAYPLKAVAALARRGRGGVLHLAASRAQHALSTLPLLALTVAFALVVAAGLVRGTLADGQQTASWERIVADARLTSAGSPITDDQVAAVSRAAGVDAAAVATVLPGTQMRVGTAYDRINVVAVDSAAFDRLLAAGPLPYGGELRGLTGAGSGADDGLPVVVSPDSFARLGAQETQIFVAQKYVKVKPVAAASLTSDGWLAGPVLYVERSGLPSLEDTNAFAGSMTLWASGPGAAQAVHAVATRDQVVQTRQGWIEQQRDLGLVDDLLLLLWFAVGAVGLLAAIALIETVLSGARDRGRTLSFIRTLGFTVRQGRWLTFGELVPLVLTGVVAGTLAGVGIVALLGPALGLVVTTGGVTDPALSFDPPFALAAVGCALALLVLAGALALLVLAVLVETASRRRDRLAEVLRVGDTR